VFIFGFIHLSENRWQDSENPDKIRQPNVTAINDASSLSAKVMARILHLRYPGLSRRRLWVRVPSSSRPIPRPATPCTSCADNRPIVQGAGDDVGGLGSLVAKIPSTTDS